MMSLKNKLKFVATPSRILVTGIVLLVAIHILQIFASEIANEIDRDRIRKAQQKQKAPDKPGSKEELVRSYNKEFMPDGTLLFVNIVPAKRNGYRYNSSNEVVLDGAKTTVWDKDANQVWEGNYQDLPYKYLRWTRGINNIGRMDRNSGYSAISPELSRPFEVPVRDGKKLLEMWRYNMERQCFEGFAAGGGRVGFIGGEGFSGSKAGIVPLGDVKAFAAWCPKSTVSPTLLWITDRKLYEFDFENRKFDTLFETTDSYIDWHRIAWKNWRSDRYDRDAEELQYRPSIQIKTLDRKYHLVMKAPKETFTFEVPEELKGAYTQMLATNKGMFLRDTGNTRWIPEKFQGSIKKIEQWRKQQEGKPVKAWTNLYKLNAEGTPELLNRYEWTVPDNSSVRMNYHETLNSKVRIYGNSLSPLIYMLPAKMCYLYGYEKLRLRRSRILHFVNDLSIVYPYKLSLTWIVSGVMVLLVFVHGWPRRTSWSRLVGWMLFTASFNLAGMLTYYALNHTTAIKCASCKKKRSLETDSCIRCGAQLPRPQRRQTDLILHG